MDLESAINVYTLYIYKLKNKKKQQQKKELYLGITNNHIRKSI